MRITGFNRELRLREPTASRFDPTDTSARQPHSGAAFPVATVEDGHVAAQEDIAEDPEGPCRRRHVQSLEAGQAEADATPSNLQGDKTRHGCYARGPCFFLGAKLRPAHYPRALEIFLWPLLGPSDVSLPDPSSQTPLACVALTSL